MEFQNLKLEKERETEESKKQKRQGIEKKQRVPSAWWATNGDNELDCLREYLRDSGQRICFSIGLRICFMNE